MRRIMVLMCLSCAVLLFVPPALGDGGYFFTRDFVGELAQTRQEVLLAIHPGTTDSVDRVTYVLRSNYEGDPSEFAWVIPVPGTPEEVVAHESGDLLDWLDAMSAPRFSFFTGGDLMPPGGGWGCAAHAPLGDAGNDTDMVQVEASGQAGIFDWFALTSTGSTALLDWLTENDFAVPAEADQVLDHYVQQGMHFLALRISQPDEVGSDGDVQIPPIQFTCQTTQRIYPMVISQVSAADQTEVLIYVLAEHRAEAANVPNAEILAEAIHYDPASPSLTNYASVFSQTLAMFDGMVLITEHAVPASPLAHVWPDMPEDVLDVTFLTRLRTMATPEQMTVDLEFQDAASDEILHAEYWIDESTGSGAAAAVSGPLALLLLFGLFRTAHRRRSRRIPR